MKKDKKAKSLSIRRQTVIILILITLCNRKLFTMLLRNRTSTVTVTQKTVKRRVVNKQSKEVQNAIMDCILNEIDKVKDEHSCINSNDTASRAQSYGIAKNIIEKHKRANPWLNRDVLNNYKRRKEKNSKPSSTVTILTVPDSVSELTNASGTSNNSDTTTTNEIKKGVRPKGSTMELLRTKARNQQLALNYATIEAHHAKEASREEGLSRVCKGTYESIVQEAEKKFGIEPGALQLKTILNRLKPGKKLIAAGKGKVSPLVAIEGYFLEIILELANMHQPVTAAGALNLINSLISTSDLQEELIAWKRKHGIKGDNEGKLGAHYWVNFKKRHPEINSKRAVRFDSKRDDWCTVENFEKMYKGVYKAMVDANVAIEVEEEVLVGLDGSIVETTEESVGRKTRYLLTRPEYCLYVDEVGCNTSQKSDGNVGGQKFIVQGNQRALIRSSHQDCHFTVLGFTNGLGQPVCCVIILAAAQVTAKDIMGLQPWAEPIGDPTINLSENAYGPDKYYPHGPTCIINGKKVETLVTCSESGSITSEILQQVLEHLDTHLGWDRSEATPFLLLDGHGSRFELPFLHYIINEEHRWRVCIGVPYGTNLWQVGDSAQQNGAFKSRLTQEKADLMKKKQELRLPFRIERHDAVGLTLRAWNQSFARVESNKKAVAERGWGPLTYNLLDHPELTRKQDNKAIVRAYQLAHQLHGKEIVDPATLNIDVGPSRTAMDNIVEHRIRTRAINCAREDQAEEIQAKRMEVFNTCLRMTAGIAFNAGAMDLSDGRIHKRVLEQTRQREQNELHAAEKRKQAYENAKKKVDAIREKSTDPLSWNASELHAMVSWFKRPGDSNIPKRKEQLLQRYNLTCHRSELDPKRKKDDEPAVVDDDANLMPPPPSPTNATMIHDDIAQALLQIAGTEV